MLALKTGDSLVRNLWLGRLAYPTLIVALEAGLFEVLKDRRLTKDQLGSRLTPALRGDGRAMEALTTVLVSLGLLRMDSDHVELTDPARMVLLKDSPYFRGSQLLAADGVTASLRRTLQHESINAPPSKKTAYAAHSDAAVDPFIETMQAHSSVTAEATASDLDNVLGASSSRPASHVLDMAGGSGCFSTALTKRHPRLRVTLADLAPVVQWWQRQQGAHFGKSRIDAVPADLFDASTWPQGPDVVLLANIVHDWGESQVVEIMRAAHSILSKVPSGRIVIVEQLLKEDRSGPLPAALASMSMLLGDWRTGKQYSFTELKRLLTKAGFKNVELGPKCGDFHCAIIATAEN